MESAAADGAEGRGAAFHFGVASIVVEEVEIAAQALAAASPTFAVTETCYSFCCHLRPLATDSEANAFVVKCWHEAAPELDA